MKWKAFTFTTSIQYDPWPSNHSRSDANRLPQQRRSSRNTSRILSIQFREDSTAPDKLRSIRRSTKIRCARRSCSGGLMTAENRKIVLGTRGSELARAQAHLVERAILIARPEASIETKIIVTQSDKARVLDPQAGRKGVFTAEIERALLAGEVDVAVHSAKDLPSETSRDAEIAAVLPRAPIDDILVSKHAGGLASLSQGAKVATGSVRRKHQVLWKRPDLELIDLRGNVPTRLRKLTENKWDAIVLARAGLGRLGLPASGTEIGFEGGQFFLEILPCEIFLPAGGQGIN